MYGARRDLPSFPTRRSSDLAVAARPPHGGRACREDDPGRDPDEVAPELREEQAQDDGVGDEARGSGEDGGGRVAEARSEEHTSELQSHVNLVCRLLLEKKKT